MNKATGQVCHPAGEKIKQLKSKLNRLLQTEDVPTSHSQQYGG